MSVARAMNLKNAYEMMCSNSEFTILKSMQDLRNLTEKASHGEIDLYEATKIEGNIVSAKRQSELRLKWAYTGLAEADQKLNMEWDKEKQRRLNFFS